MTHNPAYYVDLVEGAGFEKAMDLWAWYVPTAIYGGTKADQLPEKLMRVVSVVRKRYGYTVRTLNMKDWDNEIAKIKRYIAARGKRTGAPSRSQTLSLNTRRMVSSRWPIRIWFLSWRTRKVRSWACHSPCPISTRR